MLKVPKLDDITYEQMTQRAISRIPAMTDEWTDFNYHDPGITVLQTYAWLADMLNYYMNATGDIHVQKYLKLLGIEPERAEAASAYVVLEQTGNLECIPCIPAGTCFLAGNIPFETENEQRCSSNSFCSFLNEVDGCGMDLTAFAGQDGEYAEGFAPHFEKEAILYFGFRQEVVSGDRLYLCIEENPARNLFGDDFRLCSLEWQYRCDGGWKNLKISDGTCGLLRSGFLEIQRAENMECWQHPDGMEAAYYIRCILRRNQYDCLPRIGMVYVNPLKVVQQKTVCREGEFLPELKLGRTNGCAGQELEFFYPGAYRFSLALWTLDEEDKPQCEIWNFTEELEQADYRAKVFAYDPEKRVIRFGDGIHGAVPEQNLPVSVTGLVVSELSGGNVMAGEINRTEDEALSGCRIFNPLPAHGGRERERVPGMMERMEREIFAQSRMVSPKDYEERILKTPGLMLELVHVIPGKVYGKLHRQNRSANEVVAVVKPVSQDRRPELGETYQELIQQYIEPYRLLNTKVSIVSPEYVGIVVHGRIALIHDTPEIRKEIEECLREAVDYGRRKQPFGSTVAYGKLFTGLEALSEVRQVIELSLERIGRAARKNERGDILLDEDALGFLEAVDLEFC